VPWRQETQEKKRGEAALFSIVRSISVVSGYEPANAAHQLRPATVERRVAVEIHRVTPEPSAGDHDIA
jgi:hypothetical protein